jgi:RNA polymerase sigma-70 factor (ECF subfamily)
MSDKKLIEHYLSGQEDCLDTLLEKHLEKIFWACYRVCLNEQDANDICQNVLIKIIRHLPKFKWNSNFTTWYYRIAYNESINYLKKIKNHTDVNEVENVLPSDENIWEDLIKKDIKQQVNNQISALPLIERNIILYHYYDDLKIKEISKIMKLNENTVKTKLSRSKKILSTHLTQDETIN